MATLGRSESWGMSGARGHVPNGNLASRARVRQSGDFVTAISAGFEGFRQRAVTLSA